MNQDQPNREVFIVDDDPMVRDVLSEVFTQAGYQAVSFVDGESFVAAARERIPACVILDIYMPGRSGLEILRDIDAPNYPAPIFVASGRGDIPSAVEAMLELGVDIRAERPKVLTTEAVRSSDVVITMGCGDACPIFPGKRYEDWQLDDPAGQGIESVRPIRDEIRARVLTLLGELGVEPVDA